MCCNTFSVRSLSRRRKPRSDVSRRLNHHCGRVLTSWVTEKRADMLPPRMIHPHTHWNRHFCPLDICGDDRRTRHFSFSSVDDEIFFSARLKLSFYFWWIISPALLGARSPESLQFSFPIVSPKQAKVDRLFDRVSPLLRHWMHLRDVRLGWGVVELDVLHWTSVDSKLVGTPHRWSPFEEEKDNKVSIFSPVSESLTFSWCISFRWRSLHLHEACHVERSEPFLKHRWIWEWTHLGWNPVTHPFQVWVHESGHVVSLSHREN